MPVYLFGCMNEACGDRFESIEKFDTELSYCLKCKSLGKRLHGQELPSPAQIEVGVGGVTKGKWTERKFS